MTKQDRHERHLMRQRGAGSRALIPSFGFSFSASSKAAKAVRATPAKPRTPARQVPSARRKSVIYRSPKDRARAASNSPKSAKKKTQPAVTTATEDAHSSEPVHLDIGPCLDLEPEDIAPASSSPVRKAKFHEHLDESVSSKKTRKPRKKAKSVLMPRRKTKSVKKLTAAQTKSQETTDERAELEEAGLLEPTMSISPSDSKKRKKPTAKDVAPPTKRLKSQKTATVSDATQTQKGRSEDVQPVIKRLPTPRGKEKLPVAGPLAQARENAKQSAHEMVSSDGKPPTTPLGKLRSPSKSKLRDAFHAVANLHKPADRDSDPPSDEIQGGRTPLGARTVARAQEARRADDATEKSPKKVSKARRIFQTKNQDDSEDESWFRRARKRKN
ncbi:hypothetical protein K461DRAFT_297219 [Myriangium duriaei CBS 260.36]|uniref:Uncharacterized protein n=1 Tax=Myriangium duriaei CBS 260.36 TaxID=1168546 RepID=A0A9P4IXT0_9PEZI|nr:hypothetical protein K461DRAFT_297219 [Myriangium duriaei CBS 260.36]